MLMLLPGLLAVPALLGTPHQDEHPWPPIGPTWETDPSVAFERAREEGKVVMVYVATGG